MAEKMVLVLSSMVFLLVLMTKTTQANINEISDRCCTIGEQWFTQSRESCNPYPTPLAGVTGEDQTSCVSIIQICCLKKKEDKKCLAGKQNARIRSSCTQLHSQVGNEDARECCHCCMVGLEARREGTACDALPDHGETCNEVMQECCQTGGTGENPDETTPTTQPDISSEEGGYCDQFPGQLCDHVCNDVPGSYRCSCHEGFSLGPDGRTCNQDSGVSPFGFVFCRHEHDDDLGDRCSQNNPCMHQCLDTGYAVVCRCFEGYLIQPDGYSCADIDECAVGTHMCMENQRCVNRPGSYTCEGQPRGDETLGAHCLTGFEYSTTTQTCQDIDECSTSQHNCLYNQVCMNTEGSFLCQDDNSGMGDFFNCRTGFTYNSRSRTCEDVDECLINSHLCMAVHQTCHNNIGSYMCLCDPGFRFDSGYNECEDINECLLNRDSCLEGQQCENTIGSYVCRRSISCGTGYTLDKDSQRCLDNDECELSLHNCGQAYECQNTEGSFRCVQRTCPLGFRLDYSTGQCEEVTCNRGLRPDRAGNCVDINECIERPNVCRATQECRNTVGSYTCRNLVTCGPGFELNDEGSACTDIDECSLGTHDCNGNRQICINRQGTYLCECPDGFQMNHQLRSCEDINECDRFRGQICSQNAECQNNEGSYRCNCMEGFQSGDSPGFCADVDECLMANICQHNCRNTWGSYTCTCNSGWQLADDGRSCQEKCDVDPFSNTWGSYTCTCNSGWQLADDGRSCQDVDECTLWQDRGGSLCIGLCHNTQGSYSCSCPDGYLMLGDGRTCQDLDECSIGTANCNGPDDICINTRGNFKCETITCPTGFVKAPSTGTRNNNVRCQRQTFVCPQGDTQCLYAPLSYSVNFITFPSEIRVPADLFTMRGPLSPYRRLEFELELIEAVDPRTGVSRVSREFFNLNNVASNEVVVQLLRQIEGPQDIELQLDMKIFSKEFNNGQEIFFGTAVAKIKIFVTGSDW